MSDNNIPRQNYAKKSSRGKVPRSTVSESRSLREAADLITSPSAESNSSDSDDSSGSPSSCSDQNACSSLAIPSSRAGQSTASSKSSPRATGDNPQRSSSAPKRPRKSKDRKRTKSSAGGSKPKSRRKNSDEVASAAPIRCTPRISPAIPVCDHYDVRNFWCKACDMDICDACWEDHHGGDNHLITTQTIKQVAEMKDWMAKLGNSAERSKRVDKFRARSSAMQTFNDLNDCLTSLLEWDIEKIAKGIESISQMDGLYNSASDALQRKSVDILDLPAIKQLKELDNFRDDDSTSAECILEVTSIFNQYLPKFIEFEWKIGGVSNWKADDMFSSKNHPQYSVNVWDAHFFLILQVSDCTAHCQEWAPRSVDVFLSCDPPAKFNSNWHLQSFFKVKLSPVRTGPGMQNYTNIKSEEHNFSEENAGDKMASGWEFIALDKHLLDESYGFLDNDSITLKCELIAWKPIW